MRVASQGAGDQRDRPGHYFSPQPPTPTAPRTLTLHLPDIRLELAADAGVFSAARVDRGTHVLLSEAPFPRAFGEILDLGCGYGPIAIALALRAPGATVWAIDVNVRALELARANARRLALGNVRVASPVGVPPDVCFDAIYSNPPVRIGRSALQELLVEWLDRLKAGGRAYLVVQKHLGSDSLARWLVDQGFPTRRLISKHSYRVLEVEPRPA